LPSARSPGAARRRRSRSAHTKTGFSSSGYFADEVHNATEIAQGAEPKIRDQERTLAERLISELSETEFQPEKYEDQ
jgi:non-homologous end joining protein Ku